MFHQQSEQQEPSTSETALGMDLGKEAPPPAAKEREGAEEIKPPSMSATEFKEKFPQPLVTVSVNMGATVAWLREGFVQTAVMLELRLPFPWLMALATSHPRPRSISLASTLRRPSPWFSMQADHGSARALKLVITSASHRTRTRRSSFVWRTRSRKCFG